MELVESSTVLFGECSVPRSLSAHLLHSVVVVNVCVCGRGGGRVGWGGGGGCARTH